MYNGGHLQTKKSFQFGRFETMVLPAWGSGIISSFFLFHDSPDYKTNWQEIDFEFLGRNTNAIDTNVIHTLLGKADKNVNVKHNIMDKRTSDVFWKLSIEWTHNFVTWYINDSPIRKMNIALNLPMKLMLNLWVSDDINWAGEINAKILPQRSAYKYVRYSAYENGQFVFKWQDDFISLDSSRWYIGLHNQDKTQFVNTNVLNNGDLILKLTDATQMPLSHPPPQVQTI